VYIDNFSFCRRRLEPLVEEESESGESDKDLKESDDSSSDQVGFSILVN
jgi:hypothetical protein